MSPQYKPAPVTSSIAFPATRPSLISVTLIARKAEPVIAFPWKITLLACDTMPSRTSEIVHPSTTLRPRYMLLRISIAWPYGVRGP